ILLASDDQRSRTQLARPGSAMSPSKKSDVKRHLSTHDRFGKASYRPVSPSITSDSAGEKSRPTNVGQPGEELSRQAASCDDENDLAAAPAAGVAKGVQS
ncbi:MAG TPA: hypothetical protein VM912_18500, partial [Terriglobales bacterium]|nr:hypothetical protein [Terriglobales bacterium]